MAKKETANAPTQIAAPEGVDDYRVHDGVRNAIDYHRMTQDKPLFRQVKKNLRHAARMVGGRKGGR